MMDTQSYLIFELSDRGYGIPATCVQEIFFVPELTPIAESPTDILGTVNIRGSLLPIMDLSCRLGHSSVGYQITDSVIVIQHKNKLLGILVNQTCEVQTIPSDCITSDLLNFQTTNEPSDELVAGIAQLESKIITLLNYKMLFQPFDSVASSDPIQVSIKNQSFILDSFSEKEKEILRDRLRTSLANDEDDSELLSLAVVGLNQEYFGFRLETVYEFADVQKVTPIPCSPSHIVGNINLRGEVLNLVDICDVLKLQKSNNEHQKRAVVVRQNEFTAGITVDDIFDVIHIRNSDIQPAPAANRTCDNEYLQGVVPFQNTILSVIDLTKIFISGALVVNEEI